MGIHGPGARGVVGGRESSAADVPRRLVGTRAGRRPPGARRPSLEKTVSERSAVRPAEVLARVDAELRALWAPTAAGETPRSRACTMNLVVVAATSALSQEWVPIIDEVLLGIPARAIVVALDPTGTDALDAETTAVCTPGDGGGPAVCSERI